MVFIRIRMNKFFRILFLYRDRLGIVLFAVLVHLIFRSFIFQPFTIPSGSMIPNLLIGDYVFVSKYHYGFHWWYGVGWFFMFWPHHCLDTSHWSAGWWGRAIHSVLCELAYLFTITGCSHNRTVSSAMANWLISCKSICKSEPWYRRMAWSCCTNTCSNASR